PGGAVLAVRHAHRDVLVLYRDELRNLASAAVRDRLDDGGEVGAGIGEDVVDAAFGQPPEIGFRRHLLFVAQGFGPFHWRVRTGLARARPVGTGLARRSGLRRMWSGLFTADRCSVNH